MKITVLDAHTLNPGDLDWAGLHALGDVTVFPRTAPAEVVERSLAAEVLLVNKVVLDAEILQQLPALRCIVVTATGTNNVDLEAAGRLGIKVNNAVGYSTPSVVQHVFALLLALTNRCAAHHDSVRRGDWAAQPDFCYTLGALPELAALTMGVYGMGRIGTAVAQVARAMGMRVVALHKHPPTVAHEGIEFVEDAAALFAQSHVVSLHVPLTAANHNSVGRALLALMPKPNFLINTARGALVNEAELLECLQDGTLTGAGLDVLYMEPPAGIPPLSTLPNCVVTPHIAWATWQARQRLLGISIANVAAYRNKQTEGWLVG